MAPGVREGPPGHGHRRCGPVICAFRHAGVAGSGRGMDRWPAGRIDTALRMALPADELSHLATVVPLLRTLGPPKAQTTRWYLTHKLSSCARPEFRGAARAAGFRSVLSR